MNIKFWQKKQEKEVEKTDERDFSASKTRATIDKGYYNFDYVPLTYDVKLYRKMREVIPMLDVIPGIWNRLIGDPQIRAENESNQPFFDYLINNIPVNYFNQGLSNYINQLNDSTLSLGYGIGEIVPNASESGISYLKNLDALSFRFKRQEDGSLVLAQNKHGSWEPIEDQEFLTYQAFDQRDGHPRGYSVFYSLPFVAQSFTYMLNNFNNVMWRYGDPIFIAHYTGGDGQSAADVKESRKNVENALYDALSYKKQGKTRDIASAGPKGSTLEIKMLGTEQQMPALEIPVSTIKEQIIVKSEIPPFMFGLYKWDNRQTMSNDQKEMLKLKVDGYRKAIDLTLYRIINWYKILSGNATYKYTIEWPDFGFVDMVEEAKKKQLGAAANEKIVNYVINMLSVGLMEFDEAREYLDQHEITQAEFKKAAVMNRQKQEQYELLNKVFANATAGNGN
jgi:hypothetical protein